MPVYNCPHCHDEFELEAGMDQIIHCPHCNGTVSIPDENDIAVGTVIGGFEIQKLLGRGGMGNVYLANQLSMNRLVALKVLPKVLTVDRSAVDQFMNEVRNSGQLQHANIVIAIDAGEDNGQYYLAMTYVNGQTLEEILEEEESIDEQDAIHFALKIADALQYVWDKHKLLHKDIKPGNIMVDEKGDAFLLDMGIAQRLGESSVDDDGMIHGSPFYMSPEQTRAENLDWSSDLYSLGATLYHAIVGVPPYDGEDVSKIIDMHTEKPFPKPSKRNPDAEISPETVEFIKTMMGKKPADRFKSWTECKKAGRKLLKTLSAKTQENKPVKKKKTSSKKTSKKAPKRRRVVVQQKKSSPIPVILILLLLIGVGAGGYFFIQKAKHDKAQKAYDYAKNYYSQNPSNLQDSLNAFIRALNTTNDSEFEGKTRAFIDKIKKEIAQKNHQMEVFNAKYNEIMDLAKQRKYKEAMDVAVKFEKGGLTKEEQKDIDSVKKRIQLLIDAVNKKTTRVARHAKEPGNKLEQKLENDIAHAKNAKDDMEEFKANLDKKCDEIRLAFVENGVKRNFDAAKSLLYDCRSEANNTDNPALQDPITAFNKWANEFEKLCDNARETWFFTYNNDKVSAGATFEIKDNVKATVYKIVNDNVYVRYKMVNSWEKKKVNFNELKPRQFYEILQKSAKTIGGDDSICAFFLATGEFQAANQIKKGAKKFTAEEVDKIAKVYLQYKINKLVKNITSNFIDDVDKATYKKEFRKLKKEYGRMDEFKSILANAEKEHGKVDD